MIEFFQSNWEVILATLACFVGGLYVPGARKFLIIAVRTTLSEKVIIEFVLSMLGSLAKSSKNTVDDAFIAELRSRTGR
jgi:hypothetical protein